jgi:hypothetical protein
MKTEKKLLIVPADDGDDLDLGYGDDKPPLIPEGSYTVGYLRAKLLPPRNHEQRLQVFFAIATPGDYVGVELFWVCRISPRHGIKRMAWTSKWVRTYTLAQGYAPKRTDRLSLAVFKGKYFEGLVGTVTKQWGQKPLALSCHYSVIRELVTKEAGA